MSKEFIERVIEWNRAAGNTEGQYNVRQTALYIGLVLEETAELLESLGVSEPVGKDTANLLHDLSGEFKAGEYDGRVTKACRTSMLDATADILVVAAGLGMSQGADLHGALNEVCESNESKGEQCSECEGSGAMQPIGECCIRCDGRGWILRKNDHGKIQKGSDYKEPNLQQFICKE